MARALMILPILLLAACDREPDFDTRYEAAASEIEARAKAMDAAVAASEKAARAAGETEGGSSALPTDDKAATPPPSSGE